MYSVIGTFIFIGVAIAMSIGIGLLSRSFDRSRIRKNISSKGGQLLHLHWDPFGPGYYAQQHDRIYKIQYRDREGCIHQGHVKTSMTNGVSFISDKLISRQESNGELTQPKKKDSQVTIEEEKARLRKRLAELEEMD